MKRRTVAGIHDDDLAVENRGEAWQRRGRVDEWRVFVGPVMAATRECTDTGAVFDQLSGVAVFNLTSWIQSPSGGRSTSVRVIGVMKESEMERGK
jgi:hypothetical protein